MNKQQMHEAMQISRNFALTNLLAKEAGVNLQKLTMSGEYFISKEDMAILREADKALDRIRNKSNEWEADKYAKNTLTENPSLT
jgi:hypothetical protein